jgi:hypothetical protein
MDKLRRFAMVGALWRRSRPSSGALPGSRGAWLMLGGAFAAFAVSAGIMHSYAVFLVAFIEAFRWSRAETSIAYSVSQLVAGELAIGRRGRQARATPPFAARRRFADRGLWAAP